MKSLTLPDGATYGIDSGGNRICTGSAMGRRNTLPENREVAGKLHLEQLKWVDGDYDQGGAYWGNSRDGTRIYCAWGDLPGEDLSTRVFVRAHDRDEAKELVREDLPNVTFFR